MFLTGSELPSWRGQGSGGAAIIAEKMAERISNHRDELLCQRGNSSFRVQEARRKMAEEEKIELGRLEDHLAKERVRNRLGLVLR